MHGSCLPYEELIYEIEKRAIKIGMFSEKLSEHKRESSYESAVEGFDCSESSSIEQWVSYLVNE